jgi:hypothetical protein
MSYVLETKGALSMKDKVQALEDELLKMPQSDVVTEHLFMPNVYERKIIIPPWTVLTGAEHKTDYRVRLEKGTIAVNTDDGIKVLTAPIEFDVKAGAKRAGRVFEEEVVWVDVYDNPTNCTDIKTLEEILFVVPACGLADSRTDAQKAQIDYGRFLHQLGMTHQEVEAIVNIESDLMEMPEGVFVELKDSTIHGKGLFATKDFEIGETVCPGRLDGKRTPGGRFINHSNNANTVPQKTDDDIYVVATKKILAGEELLLDYRDSININFNIQIQGTLLCQP